MQERQPSYKPIPSPDQDEETAKKREALVLYERCLFISGAFSAACFAAWITWIPFIHMLIPDLERETANQVTTVSHTFKKYNAIVTIYLTIPLTVFFAFRQYRVFINKSLRTEEKKGMFILLIVAQISLFIVTRYDKIQGTWHYIFTFMTIFSLYLYHVVVRDSYQCLIYNVHLKTLLLIISSISILIFASLFMIYSDIEERGEIWTIACVAEVSGLLFLGASDVTDIFVLGFEIDENKNKK
tara:strand:- start:8694 stop:9419 length:726 start_codon:yes stop_codon:yes gene_type:complete